MIFPFELKKSPLFQNTLYHFILSYHSFLVLFSFFLMSSDKIPSLITSAPCSLMPLPSEIGLSSIPCRHLGLISKLLGLQSRLCQHICGAPGEKSIINKPIKKSKTHAKHLHLHFS